MKKGLLFVVIFALIGAGILLYRLDKENIESGKEPEFCIKLVDEQQKEIKYLCLGYSLIRKYRNSANESMNNSESLKFGVWFTDKKEVRYSN